MHCLFNSNVIDCIQIVLLDFMKLFEKFCVRQFVSCSLVLKHFKPQFATFSEKWTRVGKLDQRALYSIKSHKACIYNECFLLLWQFYNKFYFHWYLHLTDNFSTSCAWRRSIYVTSPTVPSLSAISATSQSASSTAWPRPSRLSKEPQHTHYVGHVCSLYPFSVFALFLL